MEVPAGIAATLDCLAAVVDRRATNARGMLDQHGRTEADRPPGSRDGVAFHGTAQDIHPSPDLRA
jgi:hypothetical protein